MKEMNRKGFLKVLGAVGVCAVAAPALAGPIKQVKDGVWKSKAHGVGTDYQDFSARDVIFTQCQQCNAVCTIQAYVVPAPEGGGCPSIVRKLSGNQYSPIGMVPHGHIPYDTPLEEAVKGVGNFARDSFAFRGAKTCLKGQAGIQTTYDHYRVKTPLKRVGERGSGVWKSISWDQAYQEILYGDQELGTPGLKEIWAYAPKEQVMQDWASLKEGTMTKEAFHNKYQDILISTDHPDLGPRSNQIAVLAGHRRDFITRIASGSLGTVNSYDHGGYCGINGVIGNVRSHSVSKQKKRMIPDYDNAQLVIVWGTNPLTANRGPTTFAPQITAAKARGMKLIVIDPRFSKTAEKADIWVPVKPGGDGALAMGMCRWIVENGRYDKDYLSLVNAESAKAAGESTWSDACCLVEVDDEKRPFLRPEKAGLNGEDTDYVVYSNGQFLPSSQAGTGELDVDTMLNGRRVKSVFRLWKERLMEKEMSEYAVESGVDISVIEKIARLFTSYGKKVGIHSYRGPAMHTNGYYSLRAINMLNHLVGNHDWAGGDTATGAAYQETKGVYDLSSVPNGNTAWGISVTRHQIAYEKTSFFETDGYPAKRPWYPMGNKLIQDVLPSSAAGYPYQVRALLINRTSPVVSGPLSDLQAELIKSRDAVELVVSSDIVIGETTQYADYVLPDLSYLESWNNESIFPILKHRFSALYQPVTRVIQEARPTEQVFIDLCKGLGLPGVGEGAFADGSALDSPEDYYMKRVVNIAYDGEPVKDADDAELEIFTEARKKALGSYYDEERLKGAIKPGEWKKAVTVLNRGGRFEPLGSEYQGDKLKYRYGEMVHFYDDKAAGLKSSYTGAYFDGLPVTEGILRYDRTPYETDKPLQFINWKSRNISTHRTIGDVWLREIRSENYVWVNPSDAETYGLQTGDRIKIRSGSAEVVGTAFVTPGIRPGVVGANFSFGHTACGSGQVEVDEETMQKAPSYGNRWSNNHQPMMEEAGFAGGRGEGILVNRLAEKDESYQYGFLADALVGGPAQQDVFVSIERVGS